jgi:hypothetical protein
VVSAETTPADGPGHAAGRAAAGRAPEAIPLHEQTLADRERVLGPEHPTSKLLRNNLAWVTAQQPYGDSGRKTGKRQWFRR